MHKRNWVLVLSALTVFTQARAGFGMATRPEPLTMLVVPARYSIVQLAFDVLRHRSLVLVSYRGQAGGASPLLHAWNGQEWVYVTMEDYREARFLEHMPARAILVGDAQILPESLVEASAWCPSVMSVPEMDRASLVNSLGRILKFSNAEWRWFAARYNLSLTDLNVERRKDSWYDHPYIDERLLRPGRYELPADVPPATTPAEIVAPADVVATPPASTETPLATERKVEFLPPVAPPETPSAPAAEGTAPSPALPAAEPPLK